MKKFFILSVVMVLVLGFAFSTFAGGKKEESKGEGEVIEIKLSHVASPMDVIHPTSEYFAKNVYERTNGRVNITVYPAGALGINKDMYEQCRLGANLIHVCDPGYLADYSKDIGAVNGPYLVDDPRDLNKVLDSAWFKEQANALEPNGFKLLSLNWFYGARHVITDKPIRNLEDIKGVTIRVAPIPLWIETFKAMGARVVTLPWPEVYSGLSQGVVDAAEAPLNAMYGCKFQEQKKVISMTGHMKDLVGMVMGKSYYDTLPPDVQKMLIEEAKKAGDYMSERTLKEEKDFIERLKNEGVTFITDVDVDEFRNATNKVYDIMYSPGTREKINKILSK